MKLTKSETDNVLTGTLGGIAEHLEIDSSLVRIGFCALALMSGIGILLYIIMVLCIPSKE